MLEYYFNDFKSTLIQYEKSREQQKAESALQESNIKSNVNESVNVNENINVKVNNVERSNKAVNVKVDNVERPNKAINVNMHDNVNNTDNVDKTAEVPQVAAHQPEHELQPATHDTKLPQHDATLQHTVSQPEVERINTQVAQSTVIATLMDKVSSAVPIEQEVYTSPINIRLIKWNGERWEINEEPKVEEEEKRRNRLITI